MGFGVFGFKNFALSTEIRPQGIEENMMKIINFQNMKDYFFLFAILVPILMLGLWSYIRANNGEITACVKKNGEIYLIGDGFKKKECKDKETKITWSKVISQDPISNELHLFDANNQDLGTLLDVTLYPTGLSDLKIYHTFHSSIGAVLQFEADPATQIVRFTPTPHRVVFGNENCTGLAFIPHIPDKQLSPGPQSLIKTTGPRYFVVSTTSPSIVVSTTTPPTLNSGSSFFLTPGSPCTNQATSSLFTYPIQEVNLPFIDPPAWPLRIE